MDEWVDAILFGFPKVDGTWVQVVSLQVISEISGDIFSCL